MRKQANYFDGKLSKPVPVEVELKNNRLNIYFPNSESGLKSWDIQLIKSENFSSSKRILLSYNSFPAEQLQFDSENGKEIYQRIIHQESFLKQLFHQITQTNSIKIVILSLCVFIGIALAYIFYLSPIIGEQAVKILPKHVEEKAGKAIYKNISKLYGNDDEKTEVIQEFYDELGFHSDYDIRIDYSKSELVNAFAIPGGQIVVFDGIVEELDNWEELAGILAHETAHVNERHSFKLLARTFSGYFILSILTGDVAGASTVVLEQANQMYEFSNSRKYEKDADLKGLEYLRESKIDPNGMVNVFEILSDYAGYEDSKAGKVLEYVSSHPLSKKRVDYLTEHIATSPNLQYEPVQNEVADSLFQLLKIPSNSKEAEVVEEEFIE